jgi:hypothetical protein
MAVRACLKSGADSIADDGDVNSMKIRIRILQTMTFRLSFSGMYEGDSINKVTSPLIA